MEILTHCFAFVLDVFMFEVFVRFCAKMCRVVTDLKTFLLKNQKKGLFVCSTIHAVDFSEMLL